VPGSLARRALGGDENRTPATMTPFGELTAAAISSTKGRHQPPPLWRSKGVCLHAGAARAAPAFATIQRNS
jgi:hypothetical protein